MNVLLIPAWRRPEFLQFTLDNLTKAEGIENVHPIFMLDHGYNTECVKVIAEFSNRMPQPDIFYREKAPNPLSTKQSRNILQGYVHAASITDGLVFMVEEDVMVSRDFFRFHEAVHTEEPNIFCCLSTTNHNRQVTTTDDPSTYYLTSGDYCSLGVSFKAETIRKFIQPHANSNYYQAPKNYVRKHFPHSSIGANFIEQDGLIRRIQQAQGYVHPIVYPHVPRAYHAGWYGYNRPKYTTGTLEEKIARVGATIYDPEKMREAAINPAYVNDSIPTNLELPPWNKLHQQQPPEIRSAL